MENKVKILWVNYEIEGPQNGLAEYNGEKVWFSRITPLGSLEPDRTYDLIRLIPEDLEKVEADHVKHCEQTGAPKFHGDPIGFRYIPSQNEKKFTSASVFYHSYDPAYLVGEKIKMIKESDFLNYFVPRKYERLSSTSLSDK